MGVGIHTLDFRRADRISYQVRPIDRLCVLQ